jgi:oligoribonuclease (3'-5' exoribonuclease)
MDTWNKGTHGRSGSDRQGAGSRRLTEEQAEQQVLLDFLGPLCAEATPHPCAATPSARTAVSW